MTKIIKPTQDEMLTITNPMEGKFDTGMTIREAVHHTQAWWLKTGQKEMKLHKMRQKNSVANATKGLGGEFASEDPDSDNFMNSGIIHGRNWDDLDKREKLQLIKHWHHEHIRKPQQLAPSATQVLQ